jgi:hypothetical protein
LLAKPGDIDGQSRSGLRLAATPAGNDRQLFDTLERFAIAAGQLEEGLALVVLQRLAHRSDQHRA